MLAEFDVIGVTSDVKNKKVNITTTLISSEYMLSIVLGRDQWQILILL
jgi:hypothetical protein